MKLAATVLIGATAASAMHLKASPGAIGGSADGSIGASSAYGAASSGAVGGASADLMSSLKSIISEISSANRPSTSYGAGSAAAGGLGGIGAGLAGAGAGSDALAGAGIGSGAAPGTYGGITGDEGINAGADAAAATAAAALASPSGSGDTGSASSKFVEGQMLHFAAANAMEHPEEVEVENAIRAAMSTPSQVGTYPMPEISAELSRGYPTSFLKLDPSSLMSGAKLSPSDVDAIAAAVEAETNQYSTRASGCGACPSGVNYGSCPAGYTESRAGECTPSPSYKGLCSKPVDISEFSEVEKDMMELTCDTCFKCA